MTSEFVHTWTITEHFSLSYPGFNFSELERSHVVLPVSVALEGPKVAHRALRGGYFYSQSG